MMNGIEVRPDLAREARKHRAVESDIHQLGHSRLAGVDDGAGERLSPFAQNVAAGRYRLPWKGEVVHKEGTAYGFPKPVRRYGETIAKAAE